jgi:chemotaxis protein histidine kinase CheA
MPLDTPLNPRAVPGSNEAPDYAQQVTDRIASEYAEVTATLDNLLAEAREMPKEVKSDADALMLGALIKRLRDLDGRCESIRGLEGEPYLRGKNAVDSFFFAMRDKIGRRNKTDRKSAAGATDILQARINAYQEQKLAEERARREAEERAAREVARKAQEEAARIAREAAEKAAAAERARKEENRQAHAADAARLEEAAAIARTQAEQAAERAEDARIATLAKPADMTRVRGNDQSGAGVTLTTAQEPFAILTDRGKVDMEMLRPFFTDAEIEKALRGWARTTGHRVKMDGAEIGFRSKGVTR